MRSLMVNETSVYGIMMHTHMRDMSTRTVRCENYKMYMSASTQSLLRLGDEPTLAKLPLALILARDPLLGKLSWGLGPTTGLSSTKSPSSMLSTASLNILRWPLFAVFDIPGSCCLPTALAPPRLSRRTTQSLSHKTSAKIGRRMGMNGCGWRMSSRVLEDNPGGRETIGLYGSNGTGRACMAMIIYYVTSECELSRSWMETYCREYQRKQRGVGETAAPHTQCRRGKA